MTSDPILRDLTLHLHDRITKVIDDYFERLKWSGNKYERNDIAEHLGTAMLGIAAVAMKAKTQSTLDEFVQLASQAYSNSRNQP